MLLNDNLIAQLTFTASVKHAMFVCKYCGVSEVTTYAFINHAKGHKNMANFKFSCTVPECPCMFQSVSALQSHMYRKHRKPAKITNRSEQHDLNSRCSVEGCTFVSTKLAILCEHLKWHIRDGKKIYCPITGCRKYFRVRSTFSAHLSRNHKCDFQRSVCAVPDVNTEMHDVSTEGFNDVEFQDGPAIQLDKDKFLTNLALFYLRMQSKMILPATTIQTLIDEVHTNSMTHILSKVDEELTKLKIPDSQRNEIISGLSKENLLKMYNEGYFKSDKTWKSFFKKKKVIMWSPCKCT